MRLKFREKVYIITLVLFLVFLNGGIFSLAYYTYQGNVAAAEEVCCAEAQVIFDAFVKDRKFTPGIDEKLVMQSYGAFYAQKNIYLSFSANEVTVFSNLPGGLIVPQDGNAAMEQVNGKRYFLVAKRLEDYLVTYAKDVSYLEEDFGRQTAVFVFASLGAGALLALILFFVLRKLAEPLERLRQAAGRIAGGELAVRADERGSDEFSRLAADFNRMAEHLSAQIEDLQQAGKYKQEMLDNLAHEIRTPLTSIRGYAEYLRDANINETERLDALDYIITESERLKHIGDVLLDDAFIRENAIKSEWARLDILIAESAKRLSGRSLQAGVEMRTDVQPVKLACDKLLVGQMIDNLAENAIRACPNGGHVVLGCKMDEAGRVELFVCDDGVGMSAEQLKHITEPFYRTDKDRARQNGGAGLGLALCARIVKAHNADMRFDSAPGKGCTVRVLFQQQSTEMKI